MKIGFSIPQYAKLASDAGQTDRFARELEAAGAASLWVGDRLLAAVDPQIGYGARMDTIPAEFNSVLDPFTLLGSPPRSPSGSNSVRTCSSPPGTRRSCSRGR